MRDGVRPRSMCVCVRVCVWIVCMFLLAYKKRCPQLPEHKHQHTFLFNKYLAYVNTLVCYCLLNCDCVSIHTPERLRLAIGQMHALMRRKKHTSDERKYYARTNKQLVNGKSRVGYMKCNYRQWWLPGPQLDNLGLKHFKCAFNCPWKWNVHRWPRRTCDRKK